MGSHKRHERRSKSSSPERKPRNKHDRRAAVDDAAMTVCQGCGALFCAATRQTKLRGLQPLQAPLGHEHAPTTVAEKVQSLKPFLPPALATQLTALASARRRELRTQAQAREAPSTSRPGGTASRNTVPMRTPMARRHEELEIVPEQPRPAVRKEREVAQRKPAQQSVREAKPASSRLVPRPKRPSTTLEWASEI